MAWGEGGGSGGLKAMKCPPPHLLSLLQRCSTIQIQKIPIPGKRGEGGRWIPAESISGPSIINGGYEPVASDSRFLLLKWEKASVKVFSYSTLEK